MRRMVVERGEEPNEDADETGDMLIEGEEGDESINVDVGGGVASLPHSRFFLRSGMRRGAVAPGVGVADEEDEGEEGDDDEADGEEEEEEEDWMGLGGKDEEDEAAVC
jgi:hypothetical protein